MHIHTYVPTSSYAPREVHVEMVRQLDTDTGMMCSFEAAAAHPAPNDPVAKKRLEGGQEVRGAKRSAQVSSTTKSNDKKARVGVSGVELCCHTKSECTMSNEMQKNEEKKNDRRRKRPVI